MLGESGSVSDTDPSRRQPSRRSQPRRCGGPRPVPPPLWPSEVAVSVRLETLSVTALGRSPLPQRLGPRQGGACALGGLEVKFGGSAAEGVGSEGEWGAVPQPQPSGRRRPRGAATECDSDMPGSAEWNRQPFACRLSAALRRSCRFSAESRGRSALI